jgi:hypothetical protein
MTYHLDRSRDQQCSGCKRDGAYYKVIIPEDDEGKQPCTMYCYQCLGPSIPGSCFTCQSTTTGYTFRAVEVGSRMVVRQYQCNDCETNIRNSG